MSSPLLIGSAKTAMNGKILSQIANFDGEKTIYKASLNLSVTSIEKKIYFEEKDEIVSFQAVNFQKNRDAWVFQPINHWSDGYLTSGATIKNTLQTQFESDPEIAVLGPMLQYEIFFASAGTYDLWGYGYASDNGAFWSIQNDSTNIQKLVLGDVTPNIPYWTKFGTIDVNEGGIYTFEVFLSDATSVVLDQWYFTTNTTFEPNSYTSPIATISDGPYNTILRLRTLNGNELDSLDSPVIGSVSIASYLSSQKIFDNGKFNYEIKNTSLNSGVTFTDGVSLDFWQIGGSDKDFSAWNYNLEQTTGKAYVSEDYGQNFIEE